MRSETKNWLDESNDDLRIARELMEKEEYKVTVFYSQQTIEKALKAFIIETKLKLVKSHSLDILAKEAGLNSDIVESLKKITPAYTQARYVYQSEKIPSKKYNREDAKIFFRKANEINKLINHKLVAGDYKIKEKQESYNISEPDQEILDYLKKTKDKISKIISLDSMYLFGSRARGDYTDDSDVDILVVSDDFEGKKIYERPTSLLDILKFGNKDRDIICLTREEFELEKSKITFISDAMKYAIRI